MTAEQKYHGMIGLLKANANTAQTATMTGAYKHSKNALMQTYNNVYRELPKLNLIPEEFFGPADESLTIDDIGVMSTHLVGFLEGAYGKKHEVAGNQLLEKLADAGVVEIEATSVGE